MLGFRNDNRRNIFRLIPYHPYFKYFKYLSITSPGFLCVAIKPGSGWSFNRNVDEWWDLKNNWGIIEQFNKINKSDLPLFLHWNKGKLFEQLLRGN